MKNRFYEEIGRKICEIRKSKKFTQEELAWKTGLSRNFIALLEKGKKKPSIETLRKIAEVLNVKVSIFFEDMKYTIPEEDVIIKKISSILKESSEEEKKLIHKIVKTILKKK